MFVKKLHTQKTEALKMTYTFKNSIACNKEILIC